MTDLTIIVHNTETNEIIEREMNADEIDQLERDQLVRETFKDEILSQRSKRAALLEKLGITEDEARLLLG